MRRQPRARPPVDRRLPATLLLCCSIGSACGNENDTVSSSVESTSTSTTQVSTTTTVTAPLPSSSTSLPTVTSSPPSATQQSSEPGWLRMELGDRPPDGPVLAGLLDGSPLIVYGLDGALVSTVSSGGRFVTTTAAATSGRIMVSDMTVFGGSVMVTGTEYALDNETSSLRMWTSTDGLTWTDVGPSGLEPSAHLTALTTTDSTVYSAGYLQESPSEPTLTPAMWRSTDGRQWEAMRSPISGRVQSSVTSSQWATR